MKLIRISAIWCTSCILTYSDWNKIKEEFPNLEYEELDYDTDDIEKYNPKDILPVIIVLKDNKEITRITGEKKQKEIEKILKELGC
jgi:thiol-disulfide isomerase/thioredoxin